MFGAQIAKLLPIARALDIRFMWGRKHLQKGIHPKEKGQHTSIKGLAFRFVLQNGKESYPA